MKSKCVSPVHGEASNHSTQVGGSAYRRTVVPSLDVYSVRLSDLKKCFVRFFVHDSGNIASGFEAEVTPITVLWSDFSVAVISRETLYSLGDHVRTAVTQDWV